MPDIVPVLKELRAMGETAVQWDTRAKGRDKDVYFQDSRIWRSITQWNVEKKKQKFNPFPTLFSLPEIITLSDEYI